MIDKRYDGRLPALPAEASLSPVGPKEEQLVRDVEALIATYTNDMDNTRLREGTQHVLRLAGLGNEWMQTSHKMMSDEPDAEASRRVVLWAVNVIYLLSAFIHPFMPAIDAKLLEQLNAPPRVLPKTFAMDLLPGHCLGPVESRGHLFSRIPSEQQKLARTGKETRGKDVKAAKHKSDLDAEEAQAQAWTQQFGGGEAVLMAEEKQSKAEQKRLDKERKAQEKQRQIDIELVRGLDPKVGELEALCKTQGQTVTSLKKADEDITEAVEKLQGYKSELQALVDRLKGTTL